MRLIIAFFLCVLATAGYAQFPASSPIGAPKTVLKNRGGASADSGTVFSVNFTDTAQANLGFLKGVPNIVIVANDTLWKRNNSATQWVKVGSGGGGGSTVDSFFYQLRQLNDTMVLFDRGDGVVDTLAISGGSGGGGSGLNKVDSVTTVGDSLFYWINGDSFFSANLALSVVNGDTSSLSTVDSTGQPARRVLFSAPNNKISSTRFFLYDTVNNKLVIGTPLISAGTGSKLFVNGNASFQGNVIADTGYFNRVGLVTRTITFNADSMRVKGLDVVSDTSRFKPQVYDPINETWSYFDRWPVTPSIDTTSLSNRINLKLNISDTAAMLGPYLKVADTAGTGSLYIRNQFAAQENKAFNIRSGRLDSLYASGSGGVHFATNTGASAFEYGGGGGTQVTFNGFAGYNANRAASYTARSFTDKNYVDSTVAAVPTVTSYGKNSGGDSTILLLSNGQRFAAKDSVGAGGGSGVTTVGTFSGSSQPNGASISGSTITFGPADATNPGMASTVAQTFEGQKTFNQYIRINTGNGSAGSFPERIRFAESGTNTYAVRIDTASALVFQVPTSRDINFWSGTYPSGSSMMLLQSGGISFGSPVSGNFSSLTNTSSSSNGILSGSGTSQHGFAFNKFAGSTFGATIFGGTAGIIQFTTQGSSSLGSSSANALITPTGLLVYGSTLGAFGGSSGARSAFTVSTTTQGSTPVPVMTRAQRVALSSPTVGLMSFDSDSKALWYNLNASTTTWGAVYAAQDTVATDANFTLPVYSSFVILPTISADRTLTLPAAASYENKSITIKVANSAAFTWSVSVAIKDATDADVTALTNDTVYQIFSDGTNWHIISKYQ